MGRSLILASSLVLIVGLASAGCSGSGGGIAPKAPEGSPELQPAQLPDSAPKRAPADAGGPK